MKFIREILSDSKGVLSSKRVIGMLASLSLLISSYLHPSTEVFSMVLALALGGLGLTTAEKIFNKEKTDKDGTNT